ncbi:hypothetical protein HNR53_003921 [Bacillus benzoevorans]|uniref:Uncharacterized protein n=1 Tax=Bacillus benzoevorans TaxID=1456 RepID=A0A7X0HUX0_9BACI|nr:hypothetical protein [Bacillus benzoevorans]
MDGARNAGKLARSVRSRGKAGDCIKRLPIADVVEKKTVFLTAFCKIKNKIFTTQGQ